MWKKAGVSEEKMARLVHSLGYETLQMLKNHAAARVLVENIFGVSQ